MVNTTMKKYKKNIHFDWNRLNTLTLPILDKD